EEGIPGRNRVVILTYQLWHDRFDADPNIVSLQVPIDAPPVTVVGVLGRGPADRQQNKIWLPLALTDAQLQTDDMRLMVMARLKDEVTLAQANQGMGALRPGL